LWYFLSARPNSQSSLPAFIFGVGIFRTISCGGWTYVTSTDDHNWHDIFMISYLAATVPWTLGCLALSPPNPVAIKWRKRFGATFFATLIPLIYYFIQHKVHRVAGGKFKFYQTSVMYRENRMSNVNTAYTKYAFFEWSLVLLDVAFDACTMYDFEGLEIVLRDVRGVTRGYVPWLPK
jgi:Frag1/DRAM/Sfk1 family protein